MSNSYPMDTSADIITWHIEQHYTLPMMV